MSTVTVVLFCTDKMPLVQYFQSALPLIVGCAVGKNDFGSVFGSVLQKNCGFRFGFGFMKLTVVSVFWLGYAYICLST